MINGHIVSNRNNAAYYRHALAMSRNAQEIISDRNKTVLMQKRTICHQKHARDDQRRE